MATNPIAASVATWENKANELVASVAVSKANLDAKVASAAFYANNAATSAAAAERSVNGATTLVGPMNLQTLVYGATTPWPAQLDTIAYVGLTGNTIIGSPTGLQNGIYYLAIDQDATGSRTITWPASFKWPGGVVPTASTAAGTRDIYQFISAGGVMHCNLIALGLSLAGVVAVLTAPVGVATASPTLTGMTINWTAKAGATGYNIYRNGVRKNTLAITGVTYVDSGLTASTAYNWTVTALNSAGESVPSAAAAGTTSAVTVLAGPTGVTATNAATTSMQINWNAVTGASGYNVYRGAAKVNSVAITTLTFTNTTLTASTSYTWTVKTINSAGVEGAASAGVTASTLAAASTGSLTAAPTKVLACYFTTYDWSRSITEVPPEFNVIYLFNAQPAGTPNASGSRDGVGNGSFFLEDVDNPGISSIKIQQCRNRGQKVLLTVGGAGAGFNFSTRTQSQNFVASFQNIATALGGVDGIDFNTFESYVRGLPSGDTANNPTEMVWIVLQLRNLYGTNFMCTMPPDPDTFGANAFSPLDGQIASALNNAGYLTYAAPQFYDWSGYKEVGVVSNKIAEWVGFIGPTKVVVGLSANYNYVESLTLAECQREYRVIKNAAPTIRGAFCWNAQSNLGGANEWGAAMKIEVGTA